MRASLELQDGRTGTAFRLTPLDKDWYDAELSVRGLTAQQYVSVRRDVISAYFEACARDWRGWEGERVLTLSEPVADYGPPRVWLAASADGRGHVKVACTVATHPMDVWAEPGDWSATALIGLEAGQLDSIAAAASSLPFDSPGPW